MSGEGYYQKLEREASDEVDALLAKPLQESDAPSVEEFDPWEILPFYGNYSSAFDDMAIQVLKNLLDGGRGGEELAHEMFREVLCKKGLCDYGTSPRVCFPTTRFKEQLPKLIEKWSEYRRLNWEV